MDTNKRAMTPTELFAYWIKTLQLSDWNIKLLPACKPTDFVSDPTNVGECCYNEYLKEATVRILSEDCYNGDDYNFEKTLIHELLHIKFALLDDSGNKLQDRFVHVLIEDMAKALSEARNDGNT